MNPMRGSELLSSPFIFLIVSFTYCRFDTSSSEGNFSKFDSVLSGSSKIGPILSSNLKFILNISATTKMSENNIAESREYLLSGCIVTSQASSGFLISFMNPPA